MRQGSVEVGYADDVDDLAKVDKEDWDGRSVDAGSERADGHEGVVP